MKLNFDNQVKKNSIRIAFFCLTFSLGFGLTAATMDLNGVLIDQPTKLAGQTCSDIIISDCEPENPASEQFLVLGTYLLDVEQLATEFGEVRQLYIAEQSFTLRNNTGAADAAGVGGFLQANERFDLAWIGVHGKQIAFQTVIVDGMSYQFMGAQSSKQNCAKLAGRADISGKLIKVVDGKWVATTQVKLYEKCGA